MKKPLKALSFKNPFAAAMFAGKVEIRSWNTNYRGWVLICSSKQPFNDDDMYFDFCPKKISNLHKDIAEIKDLLNFNGYALGYGLLVDSRPMTKKDERKSYCEHYGGSYSHVYEQVTRIKPFEWKGTQGFRNVTEEERSKIVRLR